MKNKGKASQEHKAGKAGATTKKQGNAMKDKKEKRDVIEKQRKARKATRSRFNITSPKRNTQKATENSNPL